jgi:hypothetical protein
VRSITSRILCSGWQSSRWRRGSFGRRSSWWSRTWWWALRWRRSLLLEGGRRRLASLIWRLRWRVWVLRCVRWWGIWIRWWWRSSAGLRWRCDLWWRSWLLGVLLHRRCGSVPVRWRWPTRWRVVRGWPSRNRWRWNSVAKLLSWRVCLWRVSVCCRGWSVWRLE